MTTEFDASFAAVGLPGLLGHFGQSAVYTPVDGPPVTLAAAIISPERTETDDRSGLNLRKCEAKILISDVSDVDPSATMTINSEEWPITSIIEETGAYTEVALQRPEGVEVAHEGFRGRM